MWSVWSKSIFLYLGRNFYLICPSNQPYQIREYGSTFSSTLEGIASSLKKNQKKSYSDAISSEKIKLHIILSGTLCPALSYSAPLEVWKTKELQSIANATALNKLNSSELACAIDYQNIGIAASIDNEIISKIKVWAKTSRIHIASLQPLWSQASQCRLATKKRIQALAIHEPDCVTLITRIKNDTWDGKTLIYNEDDSQRQLQVRRWAIAHAINEYKLLQLRFHPRAQSPMRDGPKVWSSHWSIA